MKIKASKRFKKLIEISKNKQIETIEEAIKKVKKNCTSKFNESIDVSFTLNLKNKKEEANLRTIVNLPNGGTIIIDSKAPLKSYLDANETKGKDQYRMATAKITHWSMK